MGTLLPEYTLILINICYQIFVRKAFFMAMSPSHGQPLRLSSSFSSRVLIVTCGLFPRQTCLCFTLHQRELATHSLLQTFTYSFLLLRLTPAPNLLTVCLWLTGPFCLPPSALISPDSGDSSPLFPHSLTPDLGPNLTVA